MELEEECDGKEEDDFEGDTCGSEDKGSGDGFLSFEEFDNFSDEEGNFTGEGEDDGKDDVEEEEHEVFAVREADTVGDPGAMVVHVEDAALAGGAVVAAKLTIKYRSGLKLWQSKQ